MGFLSNIFGRTPAAPTKAPYRKMGRMLPQAAGTGRLEDTWATFPTTVDALIYHHWRTIVTRSREQGENNDYARKFLQMVRDNIAGPTGFELQAKVKDPTGTPDLLASKALETAWDEFSKKGNYEVSGAMSRADVERLLVSTVATDGEAFAIKVGGSDAGPYGFGMQLMDPILCNPQHFEKLPNGNHIRHGIEMNAFGRPVAYYFQEFTEQQVGYIQYSTATARRVPADRVIHLFIPEKIGQKRGLPWMRTALWKMRMLSGFEDAAITNARVGAAKMGFFRDPSAEGDNDEPITMDAEAGVFEDIGNRELVQWNPQFPSGDFAPFVTEMLRSISSGLGVSYNNLASDLTAVNFSSIRQGALDEREVWKGLQNWFISAWCMPVYETWLERALLAQKVSVNGRPLKFERLEKYKQVGFQGRRWAWIDPKSEVAAQQIAIAARLTSRSACIRDGGGDPEDVFEEISREEQEMERLDIMPIAMPGSPVPTDPPADESDDDVAPTAKTKPPAKGKPTHKTA
jgi:lambda family phage portal protein